MRYNSLVSIIVPAYNVEKYLVRCLDSLIGQSYPNIEIIVVDDGAKDNTPTICDEYANKDIRIHCYHKENGGLSDARNYGLQYATGDYLTFIDSDDYVHTDYVKTLYENIIAENTDISICNFEKVVEGKQPISQAQGDRMLFSQDECMWQILGGEYGLQFSTAWGKLFKKDIFSDIRFPKGKVHEDLYVAHQWFSRALKVVYTTGQLYYYMYREDSITSKEREHLFTNVDILEATREKMRFFETWSEGKYKDQGYESYVTMCLGVYPRLEKTLEKERQSILKEMTKIYSKVKEKEINMGPSLKRRLQFFISFPGIYSKIIRRVRHF